MSKKRGSTRRLPKTRPRIIKMKAVATALALCVLAAGVAATRFEPVRRTIGLAPLSVPAAQQGNLPLSKEYIYAGGRLVATEEPSASPGGPPPTSLLATATTITPPSASVTITWVAPASGTVTGYVVERKSPAGQFAPVGQLVTGTSFADTGAAEGAAYLYRVKAVFATGGPSDYSNIDLATAVAFTDDPIIGANDPQGRPATSVYARHLTELRRAVDAVRVLAGLGAASWLSNPSPAQGGALLAAHSLELRTNLNPALSTLGISQIPNDQSLAIGLPVRAAHIQDVREKVR